VAVFAALEALCHPKALRGAEAPLFHGGAGGGGDSVEFKANVKGDGQGCPSHTKRTAESEARFLSWILFSTTSCPSRSCSAAHPVRKPEVVLEIPFEAGRGFRLVGILRLRMPSTSWTSCFAQDDRSLGKVRRLQSSGKLPSG
jgi:hypothetical protein